MSDTARGNILARLRSAPPAADEAVRDFAVMRPRSWSHEQKIQQFTTALEAARAQVLRVRPQEWVQRLAEVLSVESPRNLLCAPHTAIGRQLAEAAGRADRGLPPLVPYPAAVEAFKEQLFFDIDAAITTARAGIAETGTLILWPTPDEPRLMSLVPPLHIALLEADRLYGNFWEALTAERWAEGMPTNALLISGPSKTADIEQTLAYGVHGPKALIVLLLDGQAPA